MVAKLTEPNLRLRIIRLQQCLVSSLAQQLKHSVLARINCSDTAGQLERIVKLDAVEILQTNRYINLVQIYNLTARSLLSKLKAMGFGYKAKLNFSVENKMEISIPSKVNFLLVLDKRQDENKGTVL